MIIIGFSRKTSKILPKLLCKNFRQKASNNIKIIFTDSLHEKDNVLSAGADLYLPKPYEIMELFQWLYKILD